LYWLFNCSRELSTGSSFCITLLPHSDHINVAKAQCVGKTILELEIRATRHCLVPMTILSGSHEATSRLFWASLTLPWLRLFSKDCVFYFWHGASQELIPAPESLVKFKDFLYELRRVWIYFSDLQYIQSPSWRLKIQNYTIKITKKIKIY
jgi:hypothetical protein